MLQAWAYLFHVNDFLLGTKIWSYKEEVQQFWSKSNTITENGLRHASGPVQPSPSITCINLIFTLIICFYGSFWNDPSPPLAQIVRKRILDPFGWYLGRDQKCSLQPTEKNAVIDVDRQPLMFFFFFFFLTLGAFYLKTEHRQWWTHRQMKTIYKLFVMIICCFQLYKKRTIHKVRKKLRGQKQNLFIISHFMLQWKSNFFLRKRKK